MGRAQRGRRLSLALEPAEHDPSVGSVTRAEQLRTYQLDSGVAGQQSVTRAPDLAHATLAQPLHQLVAPHSLCLVQPPAKALQDVRWQCRYDGAHIIWQEENQR